jgi:hypothetical protein
MLPAKAIQQRANRYEVRIHLEPVLFSALAALTAHDGPPCPPLRVPTAAPDEANIMEGLEGKGALGAENYTAGIDGCRRGCSQRRRLHRDIADRQ